MRPPHDQFLEDAASILATAVEAARGGEETGYTLLIGHDGGLQMVAGSDWPLDTLAADRGAQRAYRVSRAGSQVCVEGRAGARKCSVSSEPPAAVARGMLGAPGLYRLTG